jgi:hypothetical protein
MNKKEKRKEAEDSDSMDSTGIMPFVSFSPPPSRQQ